MAYDSECKQCYTLMIANLGRPKIRGIMCDKHKKLSDVREAIANVHTAMQALNNVAPDDVFFDCVLTAHKTATKKHQTIEPPESWISGALTLMERAKQ